MNIMNFKQLWIHLNEIRKVLIVRFDPGQKNQNCKNILKEIFFCKPQSQNTDKKYVYNRRKTYYLSRYRS